jgi:hypothetical protein
VCGERDGDFSSGKLSAVRASRERKKEERALHYYYLTYEREE